MFFFVEIIEEIFNVHGAMAVSYFTYDVFYYLLSKWWEFRMTFWLYIFSMIFIPILWIIIYYIFNKLSKYFNKNSKNNKKDFINNFSLFYLFFPGWYFLYPILLGFFNVNIQKQIKFIFLGSFIYHSYLYIINELSNVNSILVNSISIIRFFPLFIILLLIWKPQKQFLQICRYSSIMLLILIFFTQPFYKNWFYEKNNSPKNQSICYDREQYSWPCFKIFKGFRID